jgi:hypothetical protein
LISCRLFRSDAFLIAHFPALLDSSFIYVKARSSSSNRRGDDAWLDPIDCRWSQCATLSLAEIPYLPSASRDRNAWMKSRASFCSH